MSREMDKRAQAERLLRAMTEIDDRFLMEAMTEEEKKLFRGETEETSGQSVKMAGQAPEPDGQSMRTAGQTPESDMRQDQRKPGRNRIRRYSTWALTAAACLTVVIVGRYVSVNSIKNETARPAVISRETSAADDAGQSGADAVVSAKPDGAQEALPDAAQNKAAEEETKRRDGKPDADAIQEEAGQMEAAEAADEAMEAPVSAAAEDGAMEAEADAGEAAEAAAQAPTDTASESAAQTFSTEMAGAAGAAGAALMMPNPYIDTQTLEEAEEAAGFPITLPQRKESGETVIYRAIKGQMIEVIYKDEYNRETCRIRKGRNMEDDISGVDYEYAVSEKLRSDGLEITVTGEEKDDWTTAVWTQDAEDGNRYSYSISSGRAGMTGDEITKMVQEMTAEE